MSIFTFNYNTCGTSHFITIYSVTLFEYVDDNGKNLVKCEDTLVNYTKLQSATSIGKFIIYQIYNLKSHFNRVHKTCNNDYLRWNNDINEVLQYFSKLNGYEIQV